MASDDYFIKIAIKEAKKSLIKNEVPVGAVIVINNEIISVAHNQKESTFDPTAHAEIIALKISAKKLKTWRLTGASLYVTKEP